jgi:hypothetical protein
VPRKIFFGLGFRYCFGLLISIIVSLPFDDYTDFLLSSVPEMKLGWLEDIIAHRKMKSAKN